MRLSNKASANSLPLLVIHCSKSRPEVMAFQPKDLTSNIDWEKIKTNTPTWIIGRGQYIYWKDCKIIAVEKNSEGGEKETKFPLCDGESLVPSGTELYLSGHGGKMKE